MKIILRIINWLNNVLIAIKSFLWPFKDLELNSESEGGLFLNAIHQINEAIEGNLELHDYDRLVGCNISGTLVLAGKHILVDSCRVDGNLVTTEACKEGCKVQGNYLRSNVYLSDAFAAEKTNEFVRNRLEGREFVVGEK